ncbi:MAG: site-specific DNA-methyltransferase [Candidatus Cloacimonetes bacterium]|nr:site-specific DNA-methyltransferase [Candidatus Cloacimonadota bacterium]MDY0172449.1 DNA methyltransferase [Candidatus Cloacimonadaceae bacterium]
MPSTEQLRNKLLNKLKELFQLNQPDLDFGFYRIMHAKADQVLSFIENDLLVVIQDAFGTVDEEKRQQLKQELDTAIQTAIDFGAPDPETTPKVIEARAKYEAIKDSASSEAEIYDHLYRFFERYWDDGDFISRRYYTRETPGKAAPFAIPYNGEEVKLHWANADQYYIKTTEYFSNFTVNLSDAIKGLRELKKQGEVQEIDLDENSIPEGLKLHFQIVDATEGDHANVKASEASKRYFILHEAKPLELNDQNELIINFEYRPDSAKTKQEIRNKETVTLIMDALKDLGDEPQNEAPSASVFKDYLKALSTLIPTEKEKDRTLLARYLNQYTARNTMDYFIHKDLGAFLKRELDFYIKNEVMHLDDIENADAPKVEDYLAKIKVLRKIAGKLIEFMAQLEDFQKKLWLKKKFVVETNYCITLDRVPEELYTLIIANEDQHDEWVNLFAIDEIEGDAVTPAYTVPLRTEFLKANDKLVLDTRFFDAAFKAKLLSSIQDFDEQCDGLLIHSENFQALNLLQEKYREQVKCIYIDPPYNAKSSEILYKNTFKDSSWLCLIDNRLTSAKSLFKDSGVQIVAIDEVEQEVLGRLLSEHYPEHEKSCITLVHNPSGQQGDNFTFTHEFAYFLYPKPGRYISEHVRDEESDWDIRNLRDVTGDESYRTSGANCFYAIKIKGDVIIGFGDVCPNEFHPKVNETLPDGTIEVYPIDPQGVERKWRFSRHTIESIQNELIVHYLKQRDTYDIKRIKKTFNYKSCWTDSKYSGNNHGTQLLNQILPGNPFTYPKSIFTSIDCIHAGTNLEKNPTILDYFAGSGTTGHAVINLNREDDGQRKYILVEMGDYFDTVLKPRISKVIYSADWKDGKPKNRDTGISHCYKYLRLESYEDTLNNLVLQSDPIRDGAMEASDSLKEDYLLHYMLDVESRGSQSLLNIDAFQDPMSYLLKVKKPGSDEYIEKAVDLIETFNYLIGLRLVHLAEPQTFDASFRRVADPDLPQDQDTRLMLAEDLKQSTDGKWWIRKLEGWVPKNPYSPNDGLKEKVLIVWRKLTGNLEEDNLILDTWFQKNRISTLDWEFDTIYVNGSNNLPNLQREGDSWKVRLIEEEFMKRMWEQ